MEDTEQTHNALKRHVDDSDNDNNDTTHDSPSPSSNNSNNESSSKKPRVDHTEDHSADEEGDHTNADKDSTAEVTSRNGTFFYVSLAKRPTAVSVRIRLRHKQTFSLHHTSYSFRQ